MQVSVEDSRNHLKRLRPKFKPVYMFLFNDLLLLAKKKRYDYYYINLANPAAQNVGHSTRIVFFFYYYDDFNCLKTTPCT